MAGCGSDRTGEAGRAAIGMDWWGPAGKAGRAGLVLAGCGQARQVRRGGVS